MFRQVQAYAMRSAMISALVLASTVSTAGTASAWEFVDDIGPGSTNRQGVVCVQAALASATRNGVIPLGVSTTPLDGNYGDNTVAGVRLYQRNRGLEVDGVVGKVTGTFLYTEIQEEILRNNEDDEWLHRCFPAMPTSHGVTPPFV